VSPDPLNPTVYTAEIAAEPGLERGSGAAGGTHVLEAGAIGFALVLGGDPGMRAFVEKQEIADFRRKPFQAFLVPRNLPAIADACRARSAILDRGVAQLGDLLCDQPAARDTLRGGAVGKHERRGRADDGGAGESSHQYHDSFHCGKGASEDDTTTVS